MDITIKGLHCPKCKSVEMHPKENWLLIRGFKVRDAGVWWSQCLVCSGHYDNPVDLNSTPEKHDGDKGWFAS